jgi:hypothetical protein
MKVTTIKLKTTCVLTAIQYCGRLRDLLDEIAAPGQTVGVNVKSTHFNGAMELHADIYLESTPESQA